MGSLIAWIALIAYMVLGVGMFEWAWKKMKPLHEVNEERDSKFPAYRRWDVDKWKKWKFYPGAISLLPFKFFGTIFLLIILYIVVRIATLGHDFSSGGPIKGYYRNLVLGTMYRVIATLIILMFGLRMSRENKDYDYTPFLGPNYKETTIYPKYFSTYVSNHTSWLDILLQIAYNRPAFTPKKELRKIPLFGLLVEALGCIFIARGGTEEERNQIVS
jgi:hypothetical protein